MKQAEIVKFTTLKGGIRNMTDSEKLDLLLQKAIEIENVIRYGNFKIIWTSSKRFSDFSIRMFRYLNKLEKSQGRFKRIASLQ